MHFQTSGNETVCDPPSFYEDDKSKWSKKFAASIEDREKYKRKFFSDRANNVINHNDNLTEEADLDRKLKLVTYTAGQI